MERQRRLVSGRLSEIFGEHALSIDQFSRTIGFERIAIEAYKNMDNEDKVLLQSYCDGINDFVDGISLTKANSTAKLLPPEFLAVGLDKFEPWTPINTISVIKLLNFHLSWNWG